jgi:hypothetical protein
MQNLSQPITRVMHSLSSLSHEKAIDGGITLHKGTHQMISSPEGDASLIRGAAAATVAAAAEGMVSAGPAAMADGSSKVAAKVGAVAAAAAAAVAAAGALAGASLSAVVAGAARNGKV